MVQFPEDLIRSFSFAFNFGWCRLGMFSISFMGAVVLEDHLIHPVGYWVHMYEV